jgi:hypothetical protein
MHKIVTLLLIAILLWFINSRHTADPRKVLVVPGQELYKNEPSQIQFTNAEFKFYK